MSRLRRAAADAIASRRRASGHRACLPRAPAVQSPAVDEQGVGAIRFEAEPGVQCAQIRNELRHFLSADIDGRHTAGRQSIVTVV